MERSEFILYLRKILDEQLEDLQRPDSPYTTARIHAYGDHCDRCMALDTKVFPTMSVTAGMLPPFGDCELETGCGAMVVFELDIIYLDPEVE